MALTRIKTDNITDLNVTNAKLANATIQGGKLANNLTYGSDLTVSGNLTVSGTTTSVSTTNTRVDDAMIALASGASGSPSEDAGILINRGSSDNVAFLWDESADQFILNNVGSEDGDTEGNVTLGAYQNLQLGTLTFAALNDGTTAMTSTTAELNLLDGSGAGTIVNSKGVIYGSGGEVNATVLQIGGSSITATAAEINLVDGGASVGTTAVAGGDGIVTNDNGTMRQTSVDTFDTYFSQTTKTLTNKTLTTPTITTPVVNAGMDLKNGSTSAGFVKFFEDSDNGTNAVTLIGPASTGDVTLTLPAATDTLVGLATTDTLTNKTLTSAVLNTAVSGTAVLDEDNMASDSATQLATQQSIKAYVDTQDALKLNLAGGTMSGAIAMGTNKITGMGDPTANQDAATKAYVDSQVTSGTQLTLAADSGSNDTVTVGTDTLTFAGTANEVNTTVSNNQIQIGLPNDVTVGNDLTVAGNLTVSGTTTTLSTTNSLVEDSLIELNSGAGSNANDLGFIFERGSTGDNAAFIWDESEDKFTLGTTTAVGSATGNISVSSGTLVAALEGNATTASTLATARAIALAGDVVGTANFDGSAGISITTTIQANSVALGTDTTGNYVATLADAGSSQFTISNSGAESAAVTIALANNAVTLGTHTSGNYVATITGGNGIASTGATSGETIAHSLSVDLTDTNIFASDGTASRAVVLDGNGDFTAGNITATDIDGILGSNTAAAATVTTLDAGSQANFNATTTSTSVTTGSVVVDGGIGIAENINAGGFISTVDDVRVLADNKALEIGAGNDFNISHDGTDTTIANTTGILKIDGVAGSSIRVNEAGANVDFIVEGDSNTALLHIDAGQDNVGIGGAPNANAALDVNATSAILLARGTTAQRPTGVTGQFRYNTTTNLLEYYDNSGWESVSTSFTLATSQTFTGDGSDTTFTLSALSGSDSYTVAGVLVMINGVVQQPTVVYGISGTTLTFTTAPADGDLIEVRKFTTTNTIIALADADGDTQVQVEESSDEDIIRFDTGGSERMTIAANGDVDINANLNVDGNFTLGGNITLGDASSDSITINADFAGNLIPDADGTRTLGDASNRYASAFANNFITGNQGDVRFSDGDSSHFVALQAPATVGTSYTLSLPAADGSSGQALITDGSGALSFGAAGATVTNDESTNAERLVYVGSVTSGALTAATQDSGFTYNPSSGTLTAATFAGALSGNATSATTATNVTVADESSDTSCNVLFTTAATGNLAPKSGTNLTFNSSNGTLAATTFSGVATSAQYADLAEMYSATTNEAQEPGTVVMFAGGGALSVCDTPNCRAVAGIVSTDPAYLMNSEQEGAALALAGRVPCKVTGPVAPGDMMVSAGNGMAMANNDAAMGTVIGKAIEAHEGGEGVIEVLAMMM